MANNPSKEAAIVAAAEADQIGYLESPKTDMMLGVEAIYNVCREAGISTKDIEGIANPGGANSYAEYLGIVPKWVDTTAARDPLRNLPAIAPVGVDDHTRPSRVDCFSHHV